MPPIENIADAIPSGEGLSEEQRLAVVEIVYLAVAADRVINEDEQVALRRIAAKVLGRDPEAVVGKLLQKTPADRDEAITWLRAAAAKLASGPAFRAEGGASAREVAYRAAYAAAMSDLASSDEEFEFDLDLVDALGLAQDEADRLAGEVVAALQPSDGHDDARGEGHLD